MLKKAATSKTVKHYVSPKSDGFAKLQAWLFAWGINSTPQAEGRACYVDVTPPDHWSSKRRNIFAQGLKSQGRE